MGVSTNHWGVVCATNYDVVNSSIKLQAALPPGVNFTAKSEIGGSELSCILTGSKDDHTEPSQWSEWKLIPGGSGAIVYMECILGKAFAVETVSTQNTSKIYDISNSKIHISLNLKSVADAVNSQGDAGTPVKIVADTDQPVQILDSSVFENLDPEKNRLTIYLLRDGLKNYFTDHLKDFAGVFGVVLVSGKMGEKDKDFQWMIPSAVSYAVEHSIDPDDTDQNYFGLLTMIDEEKISDIQAQQIDIQAFKNMPKDANTVMVIDQTKFCKHILLPSAINVISGSKAEDFQIIDDGLTVINKNELVWDKFQISDSKSVRPVLPANSFRINVRESSIFIEITGMHYEVSAGVTAHANLTQEIKLKVVKKDDKSFVLTVDPYAKDLKNEIRVSTERAKWLCDLGLAFDIISLATAVLWVGSKFFSCCIKPAAIAAEGTEVVASSSIKAATETADMANIIRESAQIIASGGNTARAGIFGTNFLKVAEKVFGYGSLIFGVAAGINSVTLAALDQDYSSVSTLNDFAIKLLSKYSWPYMQEAQIKGGELSGALLIYINIPQK